jgi:hypothetical protein
MVTCQVGSDSCDQCNQDTVEIQRTPYWSILECKKHGNDLDESSMSQATDIAVIVIVIWSVVCGHQKSQLGGDKRYLSISTPIRHTRRGYIIPEAALSYTIAFRHSEERLCRIIHNTQYILSIRRLL